MTPDYDDYIARVRAHANARKPMTKAEWLYLGLVATAVLIAIATGH
ncbi:hypothetical protein ACQKIE_00010 [Luteibacter sp. NPDC031894]